METNENDVVVGTEVEVKPSRIKRVVIRMGATIAMGQFENLRPEIKIEAEFTQDEIDSGDLVQLLKQTREDLALSFWEPAEEALKEIDIHESDEAHQWRDAVNGSDFFRWIARLHLDAAKSLLADVVAELKEDELYLTQDEVDELLANETDDFDGDDEGFGFEDYEDDPNEAVVPDALTASKMAHLPPEEEYSEADDRPIPGLPEPTGDIPF
jgi:hypothetical protein